MTKLVAILLAVLAPASAHASVRNAGPNGFEISHSVNLVVPPDRAYAAFAALPKWWSKAHTYSGDAANVSLDLNPGGCWCERWDGGAVEFMHVAYVKPGEQVMLRGALGPMLFEPVIATMDFKVERIAGGSKATLTYKAYGFTAGNAAQIAPAVDGVLGDAMKRYRSYAAAAPKS